MVSASKILTVSYGTFSCTLEGFDDPFSTMRSIAEYFRDLAADDRYFGAEPPTPDADMLHRIAEREIQRKVDARVEDNNIVLRQTDSAQPVGKATLVPGEALLQQPEPTETAVSALTHTEIARQPAPKPAAEPVAEPESVSETVTEAVTDAVTEPAPEPAPEPSPEPESVAAPDLSDASIAAKLQRIRAVVGASPSDGTGVDPGNNLENGLGDDFFAGSAALDAEPDFDDSALAESAESDDGEGEDATSHLLARVAQGTPPAETNDFTGDSTGDFTEDFAKDILDDIADVTDTADDSILLSGISAALQDSPSTPEVSVEIEDERVEIEQEILEDENDLIDAEPPKPIAVARVVKVRRAVRAVKVAPKPGSQSDVAPEPTPAPKPRVKATRPAPIAPPLAPARISSEDSTLSADDEASLLAELARVEHQAEEEARIASAGLASADLDGQTDFETPRSAQPRSIQPKAEPKNPLPSPSLTAFDDGDFSGTDALDRIMAETNTKLDSDEATRKRTSIAHLRAAVHARRADTIAGIDGEDDDTSDTYREDLARVVRPGRPKNGERSGRKNQGRRLAPLVLVSEQRVDEIVPEPAPEPAAAPAPDTQAKATETAVRPRRVRKVSAKDAVTHPEAAPEAPSDEQDDLLIGFSDFATQNRAKGLDDWIEAAAAYRIFVKGQETFSRPQVIHLLLKSDQTGAITREEALRAFGKLIREGVIEKIQRGRYTISDNSRFRPDQARASA